MRRPLIALLAIPVIASSILVGCGDDKSAGEGVAEKIIEAQSGGDVDIDSDGGEVTIKGKDGKSATFASSTELPDGWPDDVKLPDGAKIEGSTSMESPGTDGKQMMVTASTDDSIEDVKKHFDDVFEDWKVEGSFSGSDANGGGGLYTWSKGDQMASVTAGGEGGKDKVSFVVTISAKPS